MAARSTPSASSPSAAAASASAEPDGPARFDSLLPFTVLCELPDGSEQMVGRTPSAFGLEVPYGCHWWIRPERLPRGEDMHVLLGVLEDTAPPGLELMGLGDFVDDALLTSFVASAPGLQHLDLSGCRKVTARGLGSLSRLARLERLVLRHRGPLDAASLEAIEQLPQLRWLDLGASGLDDADARALAKLTRLERLELFETRVTDAGLESFKALAALRYLGLGSCAGIQGSGLRHLSALAHLEQLDLSSSGLKDAGAATLEGLKGLRMLDIRACEGLTDGVVATLSRMTWLAELQQIDGGISEAAADKLREALPKTAIDKRFD